MMANLQIPFFLRPRAANQSPAGEGENMFTTIISRISKFFCRHQNWTFVQDIGGAQAQARRVGRYQGTCNHCGATVFKNHH